MVFSFSDSMVPWEDFDESLSSGITQGSDSFEPAMGNLDWNSKSPDSGVFEPDADLFDVDGDAFDGNMGLADSNTDIIWDPDSILLADATSSDFCASQANSLILEARDDGVSCPSPQKNEATPTPQLFEDPVGFLENYLLPFKGQAEEKKPSYPGILSDEQIKERDRLEREAGRMADPSDGSNDPCAPYRARGYIYNVCCERPHHFPEELGTFSWDYHLSLEECHPSTFLNQPACVGLNPSTCFPYVS